MLNFHFINQKITIQLQSEAFSFSGKLCTRASERKHLWSRCKFGSFEVLSVQSALNEHSNHTLNSLEGNHESSLQRSGSLQISSASQSNARWHRQGDYLYCWFIRAMWFCLVLATCSKQNWTFWENHWILCKFIQFYLIRSH